MRKNKNLCDVWTLCFPHGSKESVLGKESKYLGRGYQKQKYMLKRNKIKRIPAKSAIIGEKRKSSKVRKFIRSGL